MKMIQVTINGTVRSVPKGIGLSALINGDQPCGGRGTCGKCKVLAGGALSPVTAEERSHLTPKELDAGVRLACRTTVLGEAWVKTESHAAAIITEGEGTLSAAAPAFSRYGAAVDIGTTTLAAQLYDPKGRLLAEAVTLNPQLPFGADVMTRMEQALRGKEGELRRSLVQGVDALLEELKQKARIGSIDGAVITGNTVMLHLLCGVSTEPLTHAPFHAKELFGKEFSASELGLSAMQGTVYLPPCISAFVGADTTCALLASALCAGEKTALLADVGTNGELALWHEGRLTVCSTAAGPAFEGAGLAFGMRGEEGAVDRVWTEDGALRTHVIGESAPRGICGSGVIDAIACLLELEILEDSGYLEEDVPLAGDVTVTAGDIRMVQLAKSAIYAGIRALLHHEHVSFADVRQFALAGGFGRYLNKENAARIGLFPKELLSVTHAVGNGALKGAAMLLLDGEKRDSALTLSRSAFHLELATDPTFMEEYAMGMFF